MLQESNIVQRLDRLIETVNIANILKVSGAYESEHLRTVVRTGNLEAVKFFHLAGDLHGSDDIIGGLIQAITMGHADIAEFIVSVGTNLNLVLDLDTSLRAAARNGLLGVCRKLLILTVLTVAPKTHHCILQQRTLFSSSASHTERRFRHICEEQ
jgi:hypothetical protein